MWSRLLGSLCGLRVLRVQHGLDCVHAERSDLIAHRLDRPTSEVIHVMPQADHDPLEASKLGSFQTDVGSFALCSLFRRGFLADQTACGLCGLSCVVCHCCSPFFGATGRPEVWAQAVSAVTRGGTVVFFGGCAPGT